MVNVAGAKKRLGHRRRVACHTNWNKRRNSHRGYPDLLQTHNLSIGSSLPVVDHFPLPGRDVTFKFRVDRTSDSATGVIVTLGDQGSIGFDGGDLEIVTGGDTFVGTFIGAPSDSAEVVVSLQPTTGLVCAWVDSRLTVAGLVSTFPYSWATSGNLDYDGIVGVTVRSRLDVFDGQLPRHFGEHAGGPPVLVEDLLFRAATMTDLATSRVPFMDKPD